MESVEEILKKCENIQGWIGKVESKTLFELASRNLEGCIVNIGTYKGKSAVIMALASKRINNGKIYAIDEREYEGFRQNLKDYDVEDYVILIINKSSEVTWDKPIKLLFIDGSHKYEDVKADFERFEPFIVKDGTVVFHDSDEDEYPDVKRFLLDYLMEKCTKCGRINGTRKGSGYVVEKELGNMLCLRRR